MAAGKYNISIEQGSTWELALAVDSTAGTDMNLTGYTLASKLAKSQYDDNPISITTAMTNASQGKFKLSLTAAQTALLDAAITYIYDVEITSASGVVTRLIQGSASISAGVTS
jgi:ribonuclease PH